MIDNLIVPSRYFKIWCRYIHTYTIRKYLLGMPSPNKSLQETSPPYLNFTRLLPTYVGMFVWFSSHTQDHSVFLSCRINCGRCPRRGRLLSSTRSRSPGPTHATSNKRNSPIENYIIPQFYLFILTVSCSIQCIFSYRFHTLPSFQ